jgi:hypothetical protein
MKNAVVIAGLLAAIAGAHCVQGRSASDIAKVTKHDLARDDNYKELIANLFTRGRVASSCAHAVHTKAIAYTILAMFSVRISML